MPQWSKLNKPLLETDGSVVMIPNSESQRVPLTFRQALQSAITTMPGSENTHDRKDVLARYDVYLELKCEMPNLGNEALGMLSRSIFESGLFGVVVIGQLHEMLENKESELTEQPQNVEDEAPSPHDAY